MHQNQGFDFKGNLLEATKQLPASYDRPIIDWQTETLAPEIFTQRTRYDALNRMVYMENWHLEGRTPATYRPTYNARGVLKSEVLQVNGVATQAVRNIEYNAKGQRTQMQYGNGTTTRYHYDELTFRLQQLRTTRNSPVAGLPSMPSGLTDPNVLQNLYYTYDPSGNIIEILDDAFAPVFFGNQRVDARNKYAYDALYRLIKAEGRENSSLNTAPGHGKLDDMQRVSFPINDPNAIRNYKQEYWYDEVGNMEQMRHISGAGSGTLRWTRTNSYATDSNRLLQTQVGSGTSHSTTYNYDTHGSIRNLGNASEVYAMQWDYRDMAHTVDLGGGGVAFYNYDQEKQRYRKRIQRLDGTIEERLYLGGMELYRKWNGTVLEEEIETHHLFLDDQRILIVEDVRRTDNLQPSGSLSGVEGPILYRYQYSNHLGSVGLEMSGDPVAQIISYEEYHPYGTTAYQAKNASIQTTAKRYKYTGMERDEETGMAYHTARYYLPWLGRWLSTDPIGIEGGVNIYEYTFSSPNSFFDKDGLQPIQSADGNGNIEIEEYSFTITRDGGLDFDGNFDLSSEQGQFILNRWRTAYHDFHNLIINNAFESVINDAYDILTENTSRIITEIMENRIDWLNEILDGNYDLGDMVFGVTDLITAGRARFLEGKLKAVVQTIQDVLFTLIGEVRSSANENREITREEYLERLRSQALEVFRNSYRQQNDYLRGRRIQHLIAARMFYINGVISGQFVSGSIEATHATNQFIRDQIIERQEDDTENRIREELMPIFQVAFARYALRTMRE